MERALSRFVLGVAIFTSSCSTIEVPPTDWQMPASIPGSECPNIAGTYDSMGAGVSFWFLGLFPKTEEHLVRKKSVWELSDPEKIKKYSAGSKIEYFSIQQEWGERLRLSAWIGENLIFSEDLVKGDGAFFCEDGWLKIRQAWTDGDLSPGGPVFFDRSTVHSYSVSNGYLYEKYEFRENSARLLGFLPALPPYRAQKWYRWRRIGEPKVSSGSQSGTH